MMVMMMMMMKAWRNMWCKRGADANVPNLAPNGKSDDSIFQGWIRIGWTSFLIWLKMYLQMFWHWMTKLQPHISKLDTDQMDTIEQKWIQSDKLEHKRTDVDTTRQKWTKSDLAPTDESSIFQDWIQMRWTVLPIHYLGLEKRRWATFLTNSVFFGTFPHMPGTLCCFSGFDYKISLSWSSNKRIR